MKHTVRTLLYSEKGSLAAAFAIMLPLIVAAVGMAVDMSNAYLVKKKLGRALDAAGLAAASKIGDYDETYDILTTYIERNYTRPSYATPHTINMTLNSDTLFASAETTVNTKFMQIFGHDTVNIYVETEVKLEVRGVEVILVLDNTGSMAGRNIETLREASENFVNILFDAASDTDAVKIGLVPYSTSVNVGPYGLGNNPDGSYYDTAFMNNPLGLEYDTGDSDEWHGCVLAEDNPMDTLDHVGNWDMYRYCRNDSDDVVCDYYTRYGHRYARRTPNYICPDTHILPLTSDRDSLLDTIDTMEANGHTLGNYGLVWGWRAISPDFPFQEGADYNDDEWEKVIIMMTDGVNTMHSYYSAYGRTSSHDIGVWDLNERMEDTCENIKDEGISLYTVTFESGVNESTKNYFRNCATSEDKYHDAPSQEDLITVFEQISRELSNLHLSK